MTLLRNSNKFLVKEKTFTDDHQNIKSLGIEMYKAVKNFPRGKLSDFFCKKNISKY